MEEARPRQITAIISSVFIAGLCSIIYELLISTATSYFMGDSIRQFSLIIGTYMASMGAGAYISQLFKKNILVPFITAEIALGFLGGFSIPLLYLFYAVFPDIYYPLMFSLVIAIGVLIGVEIPFLTRLMQRFFKLNRNISTVLSLDYLGALAATLIFPFILLPLLGIYTSSIIFGIINMGIGFLILHGFRDDFSLPQRRTFQAAALIILGIMAAAIIFSKPLLSFWGQSLYTDQIIYHRQTPYQKIVLTRDRDDIRLYLNGNLQFSSRDEYRYHESLVHVPAAMTQSLRDVLILGGGDGLAARELLKYPNIRSITLVDLDPAITGMAKKLPVLLRLNDSALHNPRVHTVNTDAFRFISETHKSYDLILSDLPDPNTISLARLYSREFFNLIHSRLKPRGVFTLQSTSPVYAEKAFWIIEETLRSSRFNQALPYQVQVPSFGQWGFISAARGELLEPPQKCRDVATRFLNNRILPTLFAFPADMTPPAEREISTIDSPRVLYAYLKSWKHWK
ncbi:MAG: polyamine aminopropyltransferase [Fibrobacterota bacterium]